VEKNQRALLLLVTIQLDESRIANLETQRLQLVEQEKDLEKEANEAAELVRAEEAGLFRTAPGLPSVSLTRQDQVTRNQEDLRRTRAALEQQLMTLRTRLAGLEKSLEEILR
jgi:hypothetical protein